MSEAGRITAIIDGDISPLAGKLSQARSQATTAVSGIESDFKQKLGSGLSGSLSGGDFGKAGKQMGGALVDGITSSFGPLGGAVSEVATALGPTGLVATAAVAGAVMIGSAASGAAREWESGMSQISKTTGIAKGSEGFETLSGQLKDLTSTMPTTVSEIQGVASAAGSLGIAQQYIAGFTQTALMMGSAFDIPAEQASVSVGKILGQTKAIPDALKDAFGKVDASEFAQHFGSAVDFVGNSLNATEADVLDFATRVQGSLSGLGANVYETAGWGGVLSSVFPSAERAAGSFDSALTQLTTNTDSQKTAADLLGISTEEFMQSMTTDPSETMLRLGSALESLPSDKLMEVSKGLGGAYGMDVFTKMVGHTDEWRTSIEQTVEAGQKGESIGQSFSAGANTADAAIQVLKNSIDMILPDMGGPINSAITPVINSISGSFNGIRKIGENLWGPFTAAISPATTAVSLLASGIGGLMGMELGGLVTASEMIGTGFDVASAFASAFGEEITKVITESETFQKITGYVNSLKTAISGISLDSLINGFSSLTGIDLSEMIDDLKTQLGSITKEDVVSGISGATGISEDTVGGVADFLGNVYDNAAEKLGWSVEKGTQDGMEAGSEKAKGKVEGDLKDAATKAAEAFAAANDAYIKAHPGGMSLTGTGNNQRIIGGADHTSTYIKPGTQTDFATMLASYSAQHFSGEAIASSGFWNIFDGSGEVVAEKVLDLDAWKAKMQPVVLELADYFDTARTSISGSLESAIQDGIIDPLNEKPVLEGLIKQLDELEKIDPIEFQAAGLDKLRDKVQDAVTGVPVTFRTERLETNFALWRGKNADEYQKIYDTTKIVPIEANERKLWDTLTLASDRGRDLYSYIDTAVMSGKIEDIEAIPAAINELAKVDPELLSLEATTERLKTAEDLYADQVKIVNGRFVVLDENGKALSSSHLATSQAANILAGGLTAAASAAGQFAAKAGSLDNIFGSYATSLRSNATQSAEYNYLGSGGRTSWNNVFGNYTSQFTLPKFAEGGIVDQPTAIFGEAGREAFVPISDRAAGLRILPQVMRELGIPGYAKGSAGSSLRPPAGSDLNNFGKQDYLSDGAVTILTDNLGSCAGACELNADSVARNTVASENWLDCSAINSNSLQENTAAMQQLPAAISSAMSTATISKTVSIDSSPSGALVTGLSKNGYVVSYDPRTDTCAGIPFNAPDPSLKTTDPFYLGLTKNSPAYKSVEEDGWGGAVAQALTPELAAMQEQYQQQIKESEKTAENTQQIATNTGNMVSGFSAMSGALVAASNGSGYTYSSDNGVWGSGSRYGSFFGNSWISGGAAGVGAGWDYEPSWGGEAASRMTSYNGGYTSRSGSFTAGNGGYQLPAIFRARGGLIDRPELAIVGEAGTEMILPAPLTSAVLDMTARGGSGGEKSITVHYSPTINGAGMSADEVAAMLEKDHEKLIKEISEAANGFWR